MVFNPFWLCCLCCPADLSDRITSCVANSADAAFEGAAECVGQIIAFIFGPLMIFLGPLMVVLALGIIGLLSYVFFAIVLPMLAGPEGILSFKGLMHISIVTFILINVLFNYYKCLVVKNDHRSAQYRVVVRELALATGVQYPESEEEVETFRLNYEKKMKGRTEQRRQQAKGSVERVQENNSNILDREYGDSQNVGLRRRPSGVTDKAGKNRRETGHLPLVSMQKYQHGCFLDQTSGDGVLIPASRSHRGHITIKFVTVWFSTWTIIARGRSTRSVISTTDTSSLL